MIRVLMTAYQQIKHIQTNRREQLAPVEKQLGFLFSAG